MVPVVPEQYPPEFKGDVVTVARRGDLSVAEVAVDFGVAEESVRRGLLRCELAPTMTHPLVRDPAAEGISVRSACGALGFSTQAYCAWLRQPVGDRELADAYVMNALIDAHGDDPAFGYRFLADELERAGIDVGERRV